MDTADGIGVCSRPLDRRLTAGDGSVLVPGEGWECELPLPVRLARAAFRRR
jgi:hypothetical protein